MSEAQVNIVVYRYTNILFAVIGMSVLLLGFIFWDGLTEMVKIWDTQEAYGHGYMIPFITLFLFWQSKDKLEQIQFEGSRFGLLLIVIGFVVFLLGKFSTIYVIINYGFVITLIGVTLALVGRGGMAYLIWPLIFLFFMIPLPVFIYRELSGSLQLISSQIGVAVIRLFDISVYLEGNVIDLGVYKLQVVEACSGLNYLFPLMSLAFITAYFFNAPLWKRVVLFLSGIPITVGMNSFRIGMIGVLVEYAGIEQAEGFLHDFEGWLIFMACLGVLILEMWLFTKFSSEKRPLMEVFGVDMPEPTPKDSTVSIRLVPKTFSISLVILIVMAVVSLSIETREEFIPQRSLFSGYPDDLGEWKGKDSTMEQKYLKLLKLDDYLMTDYRNDIGDSVNFYVAYYASQKAGESAHSPRSCIPGDGWLISDLRTQKLEGAKTKGGDFNVNRLLISRGEDKQIVYYWFQQRGRNITNEYAVKWYLLWDSIVLNRSDGSLIRLTTSLKPGEDIANADRRLTEFAKVIQPSLSKYIPE